MTSGVLVIPSAARIACVSLPHFAAQIEQHDHDALHGQPVIVGEHEVFDYSPDLVNSGIARGMPLRRAQILCPQAVIVSPQADHYYSAREQLLAILDGFAPMVEDTALDRAYLNLEQQQTDNSWGADLAQAIQRQLGVRAALGLAINKFVAEVASLSLGLNRTLTISPGYEQGFLAAYPLAVLPLDDETQRRLTLLGIHTVGQYAALPARSILNQFGWAGQRAHCLSLGSYMRPVIHRANFAVEVVHCDFVPPLV